MVVVCLWTNCRNQLRCKMMQVLQLLSPTSWIDVEKWSRQLIHAANLKEQDLDQLTIQRGQDSAWSTWNHQLDNIHIHSYSESILLSWRIAVPTHARLLRYYWQLWWLIWSAHGFLLSLGTGGDSRMCRHWPGASSSPAGRLVNMEQYQRTEKVWKWNSMCGPLLKKNTLFSYLSLEFQTTASPTWTCSLQVSWRTGFFSRTAFLHWYFTTFSNHEIKYSTPCIIYVNFHKKYTYMFPNYIEGAECEC